MGLIYIIRHGETDVNVSGRVNDVNIDTSINATGIKQAKATGKYLKKTRKLNGSNCIIYASPSKRAVQTATIIKNIIDKKIKIKYDRRILETDKGVMSGLYKTDKIVKKYNRSIDAELKNRDTLYQRENIFKILNKINPLYNVEPVDKVRNRVIYFFNNLPINKNIIVITHAGIITSSMVFLMNIIQTMEGDISKGKNCTITVIKKEGKSKPKYSLLTFPNTEHL